MASGTDQAITPPGVLLTGASSQIGVFAIPRLVRAGFRVFAVSRKGKPKGYPAFRQVEWLDETDASHASQGCQYLLSAGPMELAQKFLGMGMQFQSVVVFSSSSVENKHESLDLIERSQIRDMLKAESEIQLAAKKEGSKLVIFRPTLIYGCGLDTNISRLASWILRFGFVPLNGNAAGLRQPVHADDLASVAITALLSKDNLPPTMTVTGGSTLSYADMVSRIFVAFEKPVRFAHLPQWLFVFLVRLLGSLKPKWGINSEMVRRQQVDLVFEDRQIRQLLGFEPRAYSPLKEDFVLPEFRSSQ